MFHRTYWQASTCHYLLSLIPAVADWGYNPSYSCAEDVMVESIRLHFAANCEDIKLLEVKFKDKLAFLMKVAALLLWWTSTLRYNFHTVTAYGMGLLARWKAECLGFILLH